MTLFSSPQGSPSTVYALVRMLDALGGRAPREDLDRWLMLSETHANNDSKLVDQTLQCARSLRWVEKEQDQVCLKLEHIPEHAETYSDLIYHTLKTTDVDDDRALLGVYACVVLACHLSGSSHTVYQWSNDQFVDFVKIRLPRAFKEQTFNPSRVSTWKRWLSSSGLLWVEERKGFFPDFTQRIKRTLPEVLQALHKRVGDELPPYDFYEALKQELPFIVGGALFEKIATDEPDYIYQNGHTGWLVSHALQELEHEGHVTLLSREDPLNALVLPRTPIHLAARSIVGIVVHEQGDCHE